jgi:probable HAF family extracellular repeat protein
MGRTLKVSILILGAVALLAGASGLSPSFQFASIDFPGAALTAAQGINPAGDIVGTYKDATGRQHGFLLSNGQFTSVDVPGAVATVATGISPMGAIVGRFTAPVGSTAQCTTANSPACIHGFLYSRGTFTTLTFPGHPGAFAQRIAPDGDIYGCLHDYDLVGSMFGAVWTLSGNVSLTSNGGELIDSERQVPASMNNGATPGGGIIVGHFTNLTTNLVHGFVVQSGNFRVYDVPGSTLTQIWDINPERQFVGTYLDNVGKRHGFSQLPNGSLPITIDVPSDSPFHASPSTIVFGVNPDGAMVGQYTDTTGHTHGFLATPTSSN